MYDVYLRIARLCQRVQSGQCVVFISLADADAMMANPPPTTPGKQMTANELLRSLDGMTPGPLRCAGHVVRLDRQLGAGIIEIEIGDGAKRIAQIAARRTLPDGSGA